MPPDQQHAQRRKEHKGAEHDPEMQLPVAASRNDLLPRQLGTVHKEQQCDSRGGEVAEDIDVDPSGRQEGGQQYGDDELNHHRIKF